MLNQQKRSSLLLVIIRIFKGNRMKKLFTALILVSLATPLNAMRYNLNKHCAIVAWQIKEFTKNSPLVLETIIKNLGVAAHDTHHRYPIIAVSLEKIPNFQKDEYAQIPSLVIPKEVLDIAYAHANTHEGYVYKNGARFSKGCYIRETYYSVHHYLTRVITVDEENLHYCGICGEKMVSSDMCDFISWPYSKGSCAHTRCVVSLEKIVGDYTQHFLCICPKNGKPCDCASIYDDKHKLFMCALVELKTHGVNLVKYIETVGEKAFKEIFDATLCQIRFEEVL